MTKIEELDIVSKYLDQDDLEQIAKQAAYDLFKDTISIKNNKYARDNIEFYITKGTMLAMTQELEPIRKELQSTFNKKVLKAVEKLDSYDICKEEYGFTKILKDVIEINKPIIEEKITSILSELVNNDEAWGSIYSKVQTSIGDIFADVILSLIEGKYKSK